MQYSIKKLVDADGHLEMSEGKISISSPRGVITVELSRSALDQLKEGIPVVKNGVQFTPTGSRYRQVMLIEIDPDEDMLAIDQWKFLDQLDTQLQQLSRSSRL